AEVEHGERLVVFLAGEEDADALVRQNALHEIVVVVGIESDVGPSLDVGAGLGLGLGFAARSLLGSLALALDLLSGFALGILPLSFLQRDARRRVWPQPDGLPALGFRDRDAFSHRGAPVRGLLQRAVWNVSRGGVMV